MENKAKVAQNFIVFTTYLCNEKTYVDDFFSFLGLNDTLLLFSDDICIILPVLVLKMGM